MRARQRLLRLRRWGAASTRRAARELGPACRHVADRLAYRPREIIVVALLAGGLCSGLAVERWRARHPAIAARLETEPPRLAVATAPPPPARGRPRSNGPRCETLGGRSAESASTASGLDLNRATPRELARLAGISWGLAARIVAARDGFGASEAGTAADPGGRLRFMSPRRWVPTAPAVTVEPELSPPSPSDPEPVDGTPDVPPE
jgi:hypothetical protein